MEVPEPQSGQCNLTTWLLSFGRGKPTEACFGSGANGLLRASIPVNLSRHGEARLPWLLEAVADLSGILWWLTAILCLLTAIALACKRYVDRGGKIPLWKGLYARRYVSPPEDVAKKLQGELQSLCYRSIGELLPHRYLHDHTDLCNDKVVMVAYDAKGGGEPAMFHVAFRARYAHAVVVHLGLVMVAPDHRKKGLQKAALLNMALCCLTFATARYVVTDIADSPTNSKLLCDHLDEVFPHYRHHPLHSRPLPWQYDVARFLLDMHRGDFGTSSNAQLDPSSLAVRGSNLPEGGGSAPLCQHANERRSRDERANSFVEAILGPPPTSDEVMHVGVASLWGLLRLTMIRSSKLVRRIWCACLCARFCLDLGPSAAIGRGDRCLAAFASFCRRARMRVQACGEREATSSSGGVVLASNHLSWIDFPVIASCCSRLPRPVVRDDLRKEGMFGGIAQFVVRRLGAVSLDRWNKRSSRKARSEIKGAVENGDAVLLFPEGSSQRGGEPKEFKVGGFKAAWEAGSRVQPVAVFYSEPIGLDPPDNALERTSRLLPHQTQALVKFGPPLDPALYSSPGELAEGARVAVRSALHDIRPDFHPDHPKAA